MFDHANSQIKNIFLVSDKTMTWNITGISTEEHLGLLPESKTGFSCSNYHTYGNIL
jgi:hypothetical protein